MYTELTGLRNALTPSLEAVCTTAKRLTGPTNDLGFLMKALYTDSLAVSNRSADSSITDRPDSGMERTDVHRIGVLDEERADAARVHVLLVAPGL